MTLALHWVCFLAYSQSLKTGRPKWVVPAFLGETPPTILVPYLRACSVWKVPFILRRGYLISSHALADDFGVLVHPNVGLGGSGAEKPLEYFGDHLKILSTHSQLSLI